MGLSVSGAWLQVKEILATGQLRRNVAHSADALHQERLKVLSPLMHGACAS